MSKHSRRPRAAALAAPLMALAFATAGCGGGSEEFVAYDLPPESDSYRLTLDKGNIHTEWEFTSSQVTEDATPEGYACIETLEDGGDTPCRAEGLIFLRYDAGLALDNTARAPGSHQIRVTAYHQAATGPPIVGLRLWVSTDDGASWRPVRVNARPNGEFVGQVTYPKLSETTGAVSLRTEAWDADSNRVDQTIDRAYGLRDARSGGQGK